MNNNIINTMSKVSLCASTPYFLYQVFPNYNSIDISLIFSIGGAIGLLFPVIDKLFKKE